MPKQTIPAGGFEASASGPLHASSMGETYPWTVQPRVHKYSDGSWTCDWVAFNALTGQEIGRFIRFEAAEQTCRDMRDIERNWTPRCSCCDCQGTSAFGQARHEAAELQRYEGPRK